MHEMYGCQPAICALAVGKRPGQLKCSGCPARAWPRQARARKGQSHGTTGRLFAARARLQIDFSQNLDTKIADL